MLYSYYNQNISSILTRAHHERSFDHVDSNQRTQAEATFIIPEAKLCGTSRIQLKQTLFVSVRFFLERIPIGLYECCGPLYSFRFVFFWKRIPMVSLCRVFGASATRKPWSSVSLSFSASVFCFWSPYLSFSNVQYFAIITGISTFFGALI